MKNLISFFSRKELVEATELFSKYRNVAFSGVSNSSAKALVLSGILADEKVAVNNVLWVVNTGEDLNMVDRAIDMWSDREVFTYTKKKEEERGKYLTFSEFERSKKIELVEFVLRLHLNKKAIFVTDFEALLQNFPDVRKLNGQAYILKKDETVDSVAVIERLVSMGYEVSDDRLAKGQYLRKGDSILVYPVNCEGVVRIEMGFDQVEAIGEVSGDDFSQEGKKLKEISIYPLNFEFEDCSVVDILDKNDVVVDDEVDVVDEYYEIWNSLLDYAEKKACVITYTSFNDDDGFHKHLHFLSVLKYVTPYDFSNDLKDKISGEWKVLFFTKFLHEARLLMHDQKIPFQENLDLERINHSSVFLINVQKDDVFPQSFQNPNQKLLLITDTEVPFVRGEEKKPVTQTVFDDFLMSLKVGVYVVHADHGIAKFLGLEKKTVDGITKEYMKLGYAENDKLFVPIDQADKVNKYIGSEDTMPKLTRLGSADWNTITSKVRKETEKIAKELLALYAERKTAKGFEFKGDAVVQKQFEESFPYDETPGQIKAINDVKSDMERPVPMDRLVCGDVGFGKTEVAMRAAFKAVQNKKQVAMISPITILTDQHFKSFYKRMTPFHVRVEMLSRFRSAAEQKKILKKLENGEIDVIIGTHRLLQPDVKFKDLGLVVIDEEQRFGVKQKEKLKGMRKEVDIITLTATPIPRTLNICLNKLRDITTITTPPFGRLPIITEVRKYSSSLVREVVLRELKRGGQVYFLHNRVQTIDSFAEKLKMLIPEAKFVVAHGKLGSGDLEERIMDFKEKKYDVLVSSTIIENGIDLENANTLIVNEADKFGLAQLYQLRGRVGRGKTQAYAYFLYSGQRLKLDAKKRLRAIVEATDLGSGFQIAMKDLEIRGAGDILGANQHGVINVVGVAHFMRMLNKAVEDLKAGRVMAGEEEITDVSIELPVPAYIPDTYILSSDEKINAYQRLSAVDSTTYMAEIKDSLVAAYGKMPKEVDNLFKIIELKMLSKVAGLVGVRIEVRSMSQEKEVVLRMSKRVTPANIINLLEYNPAWMISGTTLRVNLKELGYDWLSGLIKNIDMLGRKAKHGVKEISKAEGAK